MPINLPKVQKNKGGDGDGDEEAPPPEPSSRAREKKKKSKSASNASTLFPTPKQAVTIYSPLVHVITQNIDTDGAILQSPYTSYVDGGIWEGFMASGAEVASAAADATEATTPPIATDRLPKQAPCKTRRIKVKMGSLIIKMLNRLVRDNVIAHRQVFLSRTTDHLLVRILVGERTIPILLMRCERIGVGSVVGAAFGTSLEWSMVPGVTEEMQKLDSEGQPFDLARVAPRWGGPESTPGVAAGPALKEDGTVQTSADLTDQGDDAAEEVSISSEEDVEDEEEEDGTGKKDQSRNTDGKSKRTTLRFRAKDRAAPLPALSLISNNAPLSSERKAKLGQYIADARQEWLETGSRLRVAQVLEDVTTGASLNFDYLWYVTLAAWVAAMGLITNSVAVVVASMLLSPLMGPCLGSTLGFTLKKSSLVWLGLRNECISLLMCLLMGVIVALIAVLADVPSVQSWPSAEMINRGTANGLVAGIFVAIPSGMGVALSTLGRNSGGMTGVAISLSLLPPAVNAGLCWMTALLYKTGAAVRNENDATEYAFVGTMSLCLTLINICCIFIGGCLMFKFKEVAPIKSKNTFWSRDVKIAKKHRRKEIEPNARAIKLGVSAALELEAALAKEGKLHNSTDANGGNRKLRYNDHRRVAAARRRGLAANVLEDALFAGGGGFIADEEIIPGGAASDDLVPDEITFLDEVSDIGSEKASLIDTAGKVGGLEDAGELLFAPISDKATADFAETKSSWDEFADLGIDHEDVAGAVLLS